jgi:hypothetical protein
MEPLTLARLLRASVIACCSSANVAAGSEQEARGESCRVRQRQFIIEEIPRTWSLTSG